MFGNPKPPPADARSSSTLGPRRHRRIAAIKEATPSPETDHGQDVKNRWAPFREAEFESD